MQGGGDYFIKQLELELLGVPNSIGTELFIFLIFLSLIFANTQNIPKMANFAVFGMFLFFFV